jgi:hypothetical protein
VASLTPTHRLTRLRPGEVEGERVDVASRHTDPFLAMMEALRAAGHPLRAIEVRSDGTARVVRDGVVEVWSCEPLAPTSEPSAAQPAASESAPAREGERRVERAPHVHRAQLRIAYDEGAEDTAWQEFAFRSRRADPWEALRAYLHAEFGRGIDPPSRDGVFLIQEPLGRDGLVQRFYRLVPGAGASS